jgi:ATP-dependent exoDNAse (exonuclease V) beta subunit
MTALTDPSIPPASQPPDALASIHAVIERTARESDRFAEVLRHEHIPHLSFSQITAVEFCQYRYFLQYVKLVDPTPIPDYFTKGKLLHWAIAAYYDCLSRSEEYPLHQILEAFNRAYQGENQRHLHNAVSVHLENTWQECEVIGVEKPFVMQVDPDLPPCVGVIDLILKKNDRMILVDHKTGRDFYPEDELQMAIYLKYVREQYGDLPCEFYYDHYRWVNHLDRIRKPAFQRTMASASRLTWNEALERIRRGAKSIQRIKTTQQATRNGECFRCPYQKVCYH